MGPETFFFAFATRSSFILSHKMIESFKTSFKTVCSKRLNVFITRNKREKKSLGDNSGLVKI